MQELPSTNTNTHTTEYSKAFSLVTQDVMQELPNTNTNTHTTECSKAFSLVTQYVMQELTPTLTQQSTVKSLCRQHASHHENTTDRQ